MKKWVIFLLVVALGGSLGWFCFSEPKAKCLTRQALNLTLDGNFREAEKKLAQVEAKTPIFPLSLYRGYVAQAEGNFGEAELFLQAAAARKRNAPFLLEILMAQSTNAYFTGRDQALSPLLEVSQRVGSSPYLVFFDGLANYLQGDYKGALDQWHTYASHDFQGEAGSEWFSPLFDRFFSPSWIQLHLAHCLVEEGDFLSAREVLERELHFLREGLDDQLRLANLFLGLTYFKEAQQVVTSERASYDQMSCFYLSRATALSERYYREKARVVAHLEKGTPILIEDPQTFETALTYLRLLEEWKADATLEVLSETMIPTLLAGDLTLSKMFTETLKNGPFHELIKEKLLLAMEKGIREAQVRPLGRMWARLNVLSPTSPAIKERLIDITRQALVNTLYSDGERLPKTVAYLSFLKKLGGDQGALASQLLGQSQLLWQNQGQELKGARLMDLSLSLVNNKREKERLLGNIESFLRELHRISENTNRVERLALIHDTLDHFHITAADLCSGSKVANYMADARYQFGARNYSSTQSHAAWVLKLDPQNEEATRLLGLSSYHLGDYSKAYASLKRLGNLDEQSRKALALSKVFAEQHQDHHLAQFEAVEADLDE